MFRMVKPQPWRVEVQIGRKVKEKATALESGGRSGLLVLYSWMVGPEEVIRIFEASGDDVGPFIASYPKITGLVLTVPMRFRTSGGDEPSRHNGQRVLVSRRSSTDERELSVATGRGHARGVQPVNDHARGTREKRRHGTDDHQVVDAHRQDDAHPVVTAKMCSRKCRGGQ